MNIKLFIILYLAISNFTFAQTEKEVNTLRSKYLGAKMKSLPSDCKRMESVSLRKLYHNWASYNEFYLSHVQKGTTNMVWFEELLKRDSVESLFEVVDVLVLPRMTKKQKLNFGNCLKHNADMFDTDIFSIVEETGVYDSTLIRHVWKANRAKRKIEVIAKDSIVCKDEKYLKD